MKKFWRGFRLAKDLREREELVKVKEAQKAKLAILVGQGWSQEAETEYVTTLKEWKPDISEDDLRSMIESFRKAVSERRSLDQGRH